jgi:hypothetical protein
MALFEQRPEKYFQFYAQVHFLTCEECLSHHGEISEDPQHKPPLHSPQNSLNTTKSKLNA